MRSTPRHHCEALLVLELADLVCRELNPEIDLRTPFASGISGEMLNLYAVNELRFQTNTPNAGAAAVFPAVPLNYGLGPQTFVIFIA